MQIKRFQPDKDLQKLEAYLRNQYFWNKNMTSWLPERLHDLIYRMSAQEADGGREMSMDHIFLWEEDFDNCVYPLETSVSADLPEGFKLLYGEEYADEEKKWSACSLGFHPELEAPGYRTGMHPYISRKNSSMYQDSFECIVVEENSREENDVCAYCFVYVDKRSKTALIEPVSTREKYRRKGIGTAMMHGVMLRCREKGIEKCYVNSFGWRRQFYNAAGFSTEDSIGFWYRFII